MRPSLLLSALLALACAGPVTSSEDAPEPAPSTAPAATAAAPSPGACDVGAVVDDPDPNGLNVRDAPKDGAVVGTLPRDTDVHLVEARNGWVRVRDAWHADHEDARWPEGWVHGSLLTTWLKTPEEYGPDTRPMLLEAPSADAARHEIDWKSEPRITVLGCEGTFLHARLHGDAGTRDGWLAVEDHCPSTVTTCS